MNKSKYCGITGDELANMLRKPSKYSKKEAEEIIKKAEELTPLEAFNNILKMSIGLHKEDVDIIVTALKKQITDDNEHPRKKGFRQQDNRLRLAYQEMGRYSKNEEVPQELRGKPYGDIIGIIPKDEERRWDLYLMFNMLLNRPIHDREWDKDKKCFIEYPCLLQELENRGYDVKTIYFEISKKDKRKKYVPYKTYLHCRENLNLDSKTDQKKLKALEIIKEKQVNVEIFIEVIKQFEVKPSPYAKVSLWTITGREEDKKETFETELEFYNRTCLYNANHLTQEQFDLLKEVLIK